MRIPFTKTSESSNWLKLIGETSAPCLNLRCNHNTHAVIDVNKSDKACGVWIWREKVNLGSMRVSCAETPQSASWLKLLLERDALVWTFVTITTHTLYLTPWRHTMLVESSEFRGKKWFFFLVSCFLLYLCLYCPVLSYLIFLSSVFPFSFTSVPPSHSFL